MITHHCYLLVLRLRAEPRVSLLTGLLKCLRLIQIVLVLEFYYLADGRCLVNLRDRCSWITGRHLNVATDLRSRLAGIAPMLGSSSHANTQVTLWHRRLG